ncbi:RNA 2',3'-cyclic phosphodiesterase [Candidatus Woesearchaeota archaeon]|nr:RNA 2',3'-cyclic phosphodiesterase [Candidatus Woesearchaeota archaeon]
MIRLFIALPLSEEVEQYLLTITKKLPEDGFAKVNSSHLTISFLGWVNEKNVPEIIKRLDSITFSAFTLQLHHLGFFPDDKHPRVVWIGVSPHEQVLSLKKNVEEALYGLFPKDDRFHPHLTLARIKFLKEKKTIENMKKMVIEHKEFCADKLILYQSILTQTGAEYEELWSKKAN